MEDLQVTFLNGFLDNIMMIAHARSPQVERAVRSP